MAKTEKAPQGGTAIPNKAGMCLAEGCAKNPERAEFCGEHFRWFKMGLITRIGTRAKDFDKKFMQISRMKPN